MVNILLPVGSYYKPGGTNKVIRDLSRRLSKDNFCLVLSNRLLEDKYEDMDINPNLKVVYFPKFSSNKYSLLHRAWKNIIMFKHTLRNIRKHKIEVVMTGEIDALPFILSKLFSEVRVIIRGGNPLPFSLKNTFEKEGRTGIKDRIVLKLVGLFERTILYFSDGIIAMSEWEKEFYAGYTSKEVKVMKYGVDLKTFYPMNFPRNKTLIYCGRQSEEKRTPLLQALANISGYKLNMFSNLFADEVPIELNKHSIFVHASTDLGNAPLEAAACGLPVIVLGKFPEKYVICSKDNADFIEKIKLYMKNEKKYNQVVKKNLAYIKKHNDIDKVTKEYLVYMKNIVHDPATCEVCKEWEYHKAMSLMGIQNKAMWRDI